MRFKESLHGIFSRNVYYYYKFYITIRYQVSRQLLLQIFLSATTKAQENGGRNSRFGPDLGVSSGRLVSEVISRVTPFKFTYLYKDKMMKYQRHLPVNRLNQLYGRKYKARIQKIFPRGRGGGSGGPETILIFFLIFVYCI